MSLSNLRAYRWVRWLCQWNRELSNRTLLRCHPSIVVHNKMGAMLDVDRNSQYNFQSCSKWVAMKAYTCKRYYANAVLRACACSWSHKDRGDCHQAQRFPSQFVESNSVVVYFICVMYQCILYLLRIGHSFTSATCSVWITGRRTQQNNLYPSARIHSCAIETNTSNHLICKYMPSTWPEGVVIQLIFPLCELFL